jgi:hypothetical protein
VVVVNVSRAMTVVQRVNQGRARDEGNDFVGLMGARRLRRRKTQKQAGREAARQH